ncbi:cytochrome P450 2K4-like [Gastrophryne carolinensis]
MELGFSVATYIVLALTFFYILTILNGWNNSKVNNFPPGPLALPLIGNLHIINLKKPQLTYLELTKKYGPVFSVQVGATKVVVLVGYEVVKDALVNHAEAFGGRGRTRIFQDMDRGLGIIHSRGENWKVMRRFALTTLRDFGMGKSSIEEKIIEECGYLNKKVESFKEFNFHFIIDKPFESVEILNVAVANIILAILLGHRIDYEDLTFRRMMSLIKENIRIVSHRMVGHVFLEVNFNFRSGTSMLNIMDKVVDLTKTCWIHLD